MFFSAGYFTWYLMNKRQEELEELEEIEELEEEECDKKTPDFQIVKPSNNEGWKIV